MKTPLKSQTPVRIYIALAGVIIVQIVFLWFLVIFPQENHPEKQPERYTIEAKKDESWPEKLVGDPVALFTLVLTGFTGGLYLATRALWNSTEKLVAGADKTAERQLRAYLLVDQTIFALPHNDWNNPLEVHVIFKNFGSTPAANIIVTFEKRLFPASIETDQELLFSDAAITKRIAVIGPNHEHYLRASVAQIAQHFWQFSAGNSYVVWGRATYDDVFGEPRNLRFQLRNVIGDVMNFGYCAEGNSFD